MDAADYAEVDDYIVNKVMAAETADRMEEEDFAVIPGIIHYDTTAAGDSIIFKKVEQ